ncbi:transcription termination/antitermination protein NusG [Methylobacterium sp. WSM2598]|uniref:transcription termination/antitermination protein NusG n=1 Tax=Methylobacterium sp. WSM2598 TaxID=398261 RepID=UPI00036D3F7F|nr:transcription termination/antitermination NusG family protein [Methylobacterium sp. WSM2598]
MSRTAKSKKQRLREKRRRQSAKFAARAQQAGSAPERAEKRRKVAQGGGSARGEPLRVDEGRTWHLVTTAPCQMAPALDRLREQGIPTVVPRVEAVGHREGRPYTRRLAMFHRAVFVGVAEEGELRDKVLATRGVGRVLRNPAREDMAPMTIGGGEMAAFVARIGLTEERAPAGFAEGDEVVIATGPFASFPALVEEVLPHGRLKVAVRIFGRATPLECGLADVRPAG